jgi:hypothetical protein
MILRRTIGCLPSVGDGTLLSYGMAAWRRPSSSRASALPSSRTQDGRSARRPRLPEVNVNA